MPPAPTDSCADYLLVAVLHGLVPLPFGGAVLLQVDLLQMLRGRGVEVVQLCPKGRCKSEGRTEVGKEQHL